jgi:hypothetical protein
LCADVLGAFVRELRRSLAWRAKRSLSLASVADGQTATIKRASRSSGWNTRQSVPSVQLGAATLGVEAGFDAELLRAVAAARKWTFNRRPESNLCTNVCAMVPPPALAFNPVSRPALGSRVSALRSDSVTP